MTWGPLPEGFAAQVSQRFGSRADHYDQGARLQQGVAWRLAHHCRQLELPPGPCADLGAGSGLLSRALVLQRPALRLLQVDNCPALLERNPLAQGAPPPGADPASLLWDLNLGLPPQLEGAALLASSFALHWLDDPVTQLAHWIRHLAPQGWLALAVPTSGCFCAWRRAAAAAAVPCTALPLPPAEALVAVAQQRLRLVICRLLPFRGGPSGGLEGLRALQRIGAGATPLPALSTGQLRRLLHHWPGEAPLNWEVLLLVGQKQG